MIYLDELIASHRKILRAGQLIGDAKGGAMAALGLFVAAIGYARSHITDGIVPDEFLANAAKNRTAINALRDVRLIAPMRGARWRINDYFSWNPTAEEVAQRRQVNKARQKRFRATHQGENAGGNGVTGSLRGSSVTHLSRVPTIHDPRSTIQYPENPGTPTARSSSPAPDLRKREQRPAGRRIHLTKEQQDALTRAPADDENYAVLVRLIHDVMDAEATDDAYDPNLIEASKLAAGRAHVLYPPDVFNRALRAAGVQRKGRA